MRPRDEVYFQLGALFFLSFYTRVLFRFYVNKNLTIRGGRGRATRLPICTIFMEISGSYIVTVDITAKERRKEKIKSTRLSTGVNIRSPACVRVKFEFLCDTKREHAHATLADHS